jgi:hypothetical protein
LLVVENNNFFVNWEEIRAKEGAKRID